MRRIACRSALLTVTVVAVLAAQVLAVPYASSVRNTTGTTWEFVLNEAADNVSITRNGGNVVNLGAIAAGRHAFDMTSFTNFDIKVTDSSPAAWTQISSNTNPFVNFERPSGMIVNSIPSNLAFFGAVYVNNSTTIATSEFVVRPMGDGIYALTADLQGVNLSDFSVPLPNDTTQAKAPGWTVSGTSTSAWRLSLDAAGNVIATDWSDANGGIKYAARDLTSGGLVLFGEDGPDFGVPHATIPNAYIHGSIISKPYTTGTVLQDLVVYGMDEDMESSFGEADGNNVWRWNVGSATNYAELPTLVLDTGDLGADTSGDPILISDKSAFSSAGEIAEMHFSPQHNKWYLAGASTFGHDEASLVVASVDPNGVNPPTVLWSSKQFSIDHGLDGFTDGAAAESAGINDIFREVWAVDLSNDGTKLYVELSNSYLENPYIGPSSPNVKGHVLIIPLDANGVPNIQVNDNGTPGNPIDDTLANVQSIPIGFNGNLDRVNIDVDAAGNIYVSNNIREVLQVFSPGGNTVATTSYNGTTGSFSIGAPAGINGDYDNDGDVDTSDYVLWRNSVGQMSTFPNDPDVGTTVGDNQYNTWKANFGKPPGAGSSQSLAAVPEPGSLMLVVLGLAIAATARRRRSA